jgi:hypothetical protein
MVEAVGVEAIESALICAILRGFAVAKNRTAQTWGDFLSRFVTHFLAVHAMTIEPCEFLLVPSMLLEP